MLVRNITDDGDAGWSIQALKLVAVLQVAQDALTAPAQAAQQELLVEEVRNEVGDVTGYHSQSKLQPGNAGAGDGLPTGESDG